MNKKEAQTAYNNIQYNSMKLAEYITSIERENALYKKYMGEIEQMVIDNKWADILLKFDKLKKEVKK